MKKQGKTIAQPNYVRKLHYLSRTGALPRAVGVHMLDIAHDGWCQHFDGRPCNCDPDIRLKWSQSAVSHN